MGDISAQSHLGQPLNARISLHQMGDFSPEQLKIAIASADEHRRFGVEPVYQLRNIRMAVIGEGDNAYVQLSSREPIVEPYLDFVVTLRWADGALVKNFTVLFDPPAVAENKVIATRIANNTAPKKSALSGQPSVSQARSIQQSPSQSSSDAGYMTQSGDSLWRIAKRHKPAGVSLQTMMAAIQQQNPHAFIGGDANRIKLSVAIKLPDRDMLAALDDGSADNSAVVDKSVEAALPRVADKQTDSVDTIAAQSAQSAQSVPSAEATVLSESERVEYQKEIAGLTSRVESLSGELAVTHEKMTVIQAQMQALIDQYQQLSAKDRLIQRDIASASKQVDQPINRIEASAITQPTSSHTPWWIHGGYLLAIVLLGCWVIWDHWQFVERRLLAKLTHAAAHPATTVSRSPTRQVQAPLAERDNSAAPVADWSTIRERDLPSLGEAAVEDQRDPLLTASAFTAFGRYQEAETILSQAIVDAPERSDLYLELLQVYIRTANTSRMLAMQDLIAKTFADDADVIRELQRLS